MEHINIETKSDNDVNMGEQYEMNKNNEFETLYDYAKEKFKIYNPKYTRIYDIKEIRKLKIFNNLKTNELTKIYMDRTKLFEYIIKDNTLYSKNIKYFLGELQHCFISFIIGESIKGLNQWKHIINLLCNCESLIINQYKFYYHFIHILTKQMNQLPNDFFVNELTGNNFLNKCLSNLIDIYNEISNDITNDNKYNLNDAIKILKQMMINKFNKNIISELDEPTFVDLNTLNL